MTPLIALTDTERDVIDAYAHGDQVTTIARDWGLPVTAVRGLLYRTCDFNRRRAQVLLDAFAREPAQPEPEPVFQPLPEPEPDDTISTADLIEATGASSRQVDYWSRTGYLQPTSGPDPGTGHPRRFPPDEVRAAALMVRLIRAGITVPAAHFAARNGLQLLDPGVRIVVDGGPP